VLKLPTRLPMSAALVTCAMLLTACIDITAPVLETDASTSTTAIRLSGAFESRELLTPAPGVEIYIVGVYFGNPQPTDEPLYLMQLGVREANTVHLTLFQNQYVIMGDSIHFIGGLLKNGRIHDGVLETAVDVNGSWFPVRIPRR
jgi:hypothetical protein